MSRYVVDHIGIAVRSLEAALEFYTKHLQMEVAGIETVEAEKVRLVMLPLGESRIELLEATAQDSPIARFSGQARRGTAPHCASSRKSGGRGGANGSGGPPPDQLRAGTRGRRAAVRVCSPREPLGACCWS